MPTVAEVLVALTRKIASLDEQISAARASLELKVQKRETLATTVKVLREEMRMSPEGSDEANPRRAPDNPPDGNHDTMRTESVRVRKRRADSMAVAVRALISGMEGEFKAADVNRALTKARPDVAAKIPQGYISSLLWRMANDKAITVTKSAKKGGSNTYSIKRNP